jgi:hypothetical protein
MWHCAGSGRHDVALCRLTPGQQRRGGGECGMGGRVKGWWGGSYEEGEGGDGDGDPRNRGGVIVRAQNVGALLAPGAGMV